MMSRMFTQASNRSTIPNSVTEFWDFYGRFILAIIATAAIAMLFAGNIKTSLATLVFVGLLSMFSFDT